ncbi:MAG: site-specific integrase [Sulfitobacter sp.]|nr:site-specific integrase [Sulfitobacter sp.]
MTDVEPNHTTVVDRGSEPGPTDQAELAAAAFLARRTGRTLEAYRHDLRVLFQWAADTNRAVLAATRAHIEIFRGWLEQTGLAPSTVDRRPRPPPNRTRHLPVHRRTGQP